MLSEKKPATDKFTYLRIPLISLYTIGSNPAIGLISYKHYRCKSASTHTT
jgi:hypothetical protein